MWAGSIVLLIRSPAASRTESPLWTQTCRNGCVVTCVPCSQGQSTRHPTAPHTSVLAVRTTCHTRDLFVVFIPRQIVGASHLSFQRWFSLDGFSNFDLACSRPVPFGSLPHWSKVWTLSTWGSSTSSYCGHSLDQMNQICELHRGSYLDTWSAWGLFNYQQHSGSLSNKTPWSCGRATWRSSSGPVRESPSRAAESKAMLCLWTPESDHLKDWLWMATMRSAARNS